MPTENKTRVVYIDGYVDVPGWYWTEQSGNRVIYNGPFKTDTEARAASEGPDPGRRLS